MSHGRSSKEKFEWHITEAVHHLHCAVDGAYRWRMSEKKRRLLEEVIKKLEAMLGLR